MVRSVAVVFFILLGGCAVNGAKVTQQEKAVEVRTVQKEVTPHVWSDHKILNVSAEACADKGKLILESLGFIQIVKNGNYVYGNYNNNRAVVKCAPIDGGTFVYVVVAGSQVNAVENLRNEIVQKL